MKGNARRFQIRRSVVSLAVAACFVAEIAHANPVGPVVVHGQATFAQAGSALSVTNSPGSIINWQQFSIGAGEATRFIQQSPASAVLNRVVGADPSAILGALQSNGRVFLINPNGIVFGAGARIDVAGLVASTLSLSNEDFLAGRLRFAGDPARAAAVVNHGHITAAEGGRVYLIGAAVDNQGVITAPNGEVVLAAGNSVRVTESPGSRMQVEIAAPADSAVNLSEAVYGSRGIYGGLVRNSGTLSADSAVRTADGRIMLKASNDVRLEGTSRITASGTQGGSVTVQAVTGTVLADGAIEATGSEGKGGTVQLLGERVGLINAAQVDASGASGGGTVLVGGDYQGKNPEVQNAQRAYVGPGASIRADATHEGDGGKVVVWADGDTRYYGAISARGAGQGDGGFVEVSGKRDLDFHGKVDVSAPRGEGGRVLLDPQDIVLNTTIQLAPPNNAIGTPDVAFADPPAVGTYTVQIADVTGFAELYLQATNDITVSNVLTMAAGNTIRFEADNNITINAAVTTTGTPSTARPSITFTADADASGAGTLAVNAALNSDIGGISLSGASVTSTAAGAINSTGGAAQNGGNVTINATGVVNLAGAITATGGAAGGGIGRSGGTVSITGAGGVTTAAITASGSAGAAGGFAGGTGGTIDITNNTAGNITTGALTARAGAGTGTALSAAGSISVTNNVAGASLQTGAIDTRGNNNGAGGAVTLSSQGALQFGAAATILTSGGAALAGTAGQNGGVVTLDGATVTTTGAITTSGAAGNGANQAGGNAGAITVSASGTINVSAGALTASGGNAGAGGALGTGGNAGSISITNSSTTTGNIATGALTAVSGNAVGGGAAGTAGSVTVTNDNATGGATLATGAINVNAGAKGAGGSVVLDSDSDISVTGTIQASGGGAAVGGTHAGASGGTVTITGVNRSVSGNITANGGVGAGIDQAGGNAGTVSLTGTGTLTTAGVTVSTGGATGVGAGGTAGSITLTGSAVTSGALTTTGAANAAGGAISASSSAGLLSVGAITTSGGAANAGTAGNAAGTVTLTSADALTATTITASGSAGAAGGFAGGTGGTIDITNNTAGNITTGALTARAGAGTGTALSAAGSISVTNNVAGASLQTGAIDTRGNNNGAGGAVTLSSQGALQFGAAATILTSGGAALAGTAGQNGGVVTLDGATVTTTGAITTSGAAGNGANQAGGNAGAITVSASGTINVSAGALTASGGNAGAGGALGTGGNAGSISITNSSTTTGNIATGALTAVSGNAVGGGAAGTAGSVTVTNDNATGGATLATGAINVNAGAKGAGGSVVLDSDSDISVTGTIQASGGGAAVGGTHAGASGGTVTITGVNRSVSGNITANGGVGAGIDQAGGNAGTVSLTGTGTLTTAGVTVSTGGATGVGAGGTAGSITLTGSAVTSGALTTTGAANAAGGAISASSSAGLLSVGAITTSGGAANAGTAGNAAGTVTLTSADALTATTITASGSGGAAGFAGGAGGTIQLDSSNGITTAAITASGGNAGAGNADGGSGGNVNLNTGAAATITLANITTTGGNRSGTGTAGAGGNVTVADAALLGGNTTITATGGSGGIGAGGDVIFSGTLDSSVASRTLAVNTNGATVFGDAVGSTLALTSLTTNATGTTSLGGDVTTTLTQSYGDPVTLTANATLTGTTPTFSSTVNGGGFDLALDFSLITTINGANFSNINNLSTGNGGTTQLTGLITTTGFQSYGDAVTLTGATTLTSTGNQAITLGNTVNGAQTLLVNTAGATTFSGLVGGATPLTGLTTDAGGTTSIGANISTNNAAVSFGDAVTVAGTSTISSGAGAVTFGTTVDGGNALAVNSTGATTFGGAVGGAIPLASLTTNAGGTTAINGGLVTTGGAQSYGDPVTLAGATTLRTTAGGSVSATGTVNATAGTLTLDTGSGAATFNNAGNDFGTVAITSGGAVSLVDANALTLAGGSVDTLQARTLSGNLAVSGAITATGAGDSIVLAAAQDFINTVGALALDPGPGRWLVYSTSPAGSTENGLVGAAGSALPRLYNRTFAGDPPASITEPGNHLIYSAQPTLTVTPDNKSKAYGADDPAQTFVAAGFVNDDGVLDNATTAGLGGSFARAVGESVGTRAITQGTFASSADYAISFTGGQTLSITPAPLTFALATPGQTKVYGADDPALAGIGVTLNGLVNNPAIATWNGAASVNDSAVTGTLTSLTRTAGESVAASPYAITAGSVTLSASNGNYTKTLDTANSPQLTITQAALTGTIANQSKTYGAADPALAGIPVILGGVVNNPAIVTWNGNVSVNDTGQVSTSLASLTRVAGETVAAPGPTYAITGGTLNALSGAAAGNYTASLSTAGNTLTITPAPLTVTADNASRLQGTPNPPFTATYGGFQFGETPAVLTGTLSFNTPAVPPSPPGPYPITPFGQSSTNYAISYFDGTLLVTGASVPQPGTGVSLSATNLVVGGFQQLGNGAANGDAGMCSGSNRPYGGALLTTAGAWSLEICATRELEPVRLVALPVTRDAPPIEAAEPAPTPATEPQVKLPPAPVVETSPLPIADPEVAPDVAMVPGPGVALAFTPSIATSPQPGAKQQIASVADSAALEAARRRAEMDRLELQIERGWESYQQRPRRRFIGAIAPGSRFERYIEEWRARVERTAEADYRQSPPNPRGYGSVVMTVSIRSDGSLESAEISRTSGELMLDAEALRIMRLAAPFAPFPEDLARDTDVLSITRTLTFTRSDQPVIQ